MTENDSNKYFGVSATRASMFARLLPAVGDSGQYSNGDWHEFVETYTPLIYGVCRQFNLQSSDAEDISQDAMLKVMNVLREGKFKYDSRHKFRSWLATVIRNSVLDSLRRSKRVRAVDSELPELFADEELADSIHQRVHRELLLGMAMEAIEKETRADHWVIFEEMVLSGRTAPDLSESLGVSVSNIYVICNRIRTRISDKCVQLAGECEAIIAG